MVNRRIFLFLAVVLLICDGVALWWVSKNRDLLDPYVVKIVVEKPDVAEKIRASFETATRHPKLEAGVTKDRATPGGYKVFYPAPSTDPGLLKSMLETLKHDKIPAKVIENKEIIAFTPFKTEKLAKAALPKVQKYGFQVAEHFRVVPQQVCVVTFQVEGKPSVDKIKEEVPKEFTIVRPDDISAVPGSIP